MKKLSLVVCLFAALGVYSCSKNAGSVAPKKTSAATITSQSVTGNWQVVSDNNYSYEIGDSASTYHTSTYTGTSGDYYKFTASSNVYIKEGNFLLDTGTFTVDTNKRLSMLYSYSYQDGLSFTGRAEYYAIAKCTTDSLIIENGLIAPSGYYIGETVILEKNGSL